MPANRLFLAVPVRLYHYEQIKKDFSPLLKGRWREEEHLHATIAFLGNRFNPDHLIEKLSGFEYSFDISEISALDYFAESRVFVATFYNPTLQNLYEKLAPLLGLASRELRPHVTLMRVKSILDAPAFFKLSAAASAAPIGVLEPKVALYQSHLSPEGARYEILKEWSLT